MANICYHSWPHLLWNAVTKITPTRNNISSNTTTQETTTLIIIVGLLDFPLTDATYSEPLVAVYVLLVALRNTIHPSFGRLTSGGSLLCMSATAALINIWAVISPSWWIVLVTEPVMVSRHVSWGEYRLLFPLQLHASLNHSLKLSTNSFSKPFSS